MQIATSLTLSPQNVAKAQAEIDRLEAEAETINGNSSEKKQNGTSATTGAEQVDEAANGIEKATIEDKEEPSADVAASS
jgi:hypothetical protein